jgi:hypothetical protein
MAKIIHSRHRSFLFLLSCPSLRSEIKNPRFLCNRREIKPLQLRNGHLEGVAFLSPGLALIVFIVGAGSACKK